MRVASHVMQTRPHARRSRVRNTDCCGFSFVEKERSCLFVLACYQTDDDTITLTAIISSIHFRDMARTDILNVDATTIHRSSVQNHFRYVTVLAEEFVPTIRKLYIHTHIPTHTYKHSYFHTYIQCTHLCLIVLRNVTC